MSDTTVLDSLVVKLIGDGKSYDQMMDSAIDKAKKFDLTVPSLKRTVKDLTEYEEKVAKYTKMAMESRFTSNETYTKALESLTKNSTKITEVLGLGDNDLEDQKAKVRSSARYVLNGLSEGLTGVGRDIAEPFIDEWLGTFSDYLGEPFDSMIDKLKETEIATKVWQGALVGAVAYAGFQVGQYLSGVSQDIAKLNEEIEKSKSMTEDVIDRSNKRSDRKLDFRLDSTNLNSGKVQAYDKSIKEQEREAQNLADTVRRLKKDAEEMEPTWLSLWQSGKAVWQVQNQQISEYEAKLDNVNKRLSDLRESRNKLGAGGVNLEETAKVLNQIETMQEETKTINMTEKEKLKYLLEQKNVYSGTIYALLATTKELEKQKELKKQKENEESYIKSLKEQLAVSKQTDEEKFQSKLEEMKLSDKGMALARWYHKEILKQAEEERKAKEAAAAEEKLKDRAKSIHDQFKTEQEKKLEKEKEYNLLLEKGYLSKKDHARAIASLKDEAEKVKKEVEAMGLTWDKMMEKGDFNSQFLGMDKFYNKYKDKSENFFNALEAGPSNDLNLVSIPTPKKLQETDDYFMGKDLESQSSSTTNQTSSDMKELIGKVEELKEATVENKPPKLKEVSITS